MLFAGILVCFPSASVQGSWLSSEVVFLFVVLMSMRLAGIPACFSSASMQGSRLSLEVVFFLAILMSVLLAGIPVCLPFASMQGSRLSSEVVSSLVILMSMLFAGIPVCSPSASVQGTWLTSEVVFSLALLMSICRLHVQNSPLPLACFAISFSSVAVQGSSLSSGATLLFYFSAVDLFLLLPLDALGEHCLHLLLNNAGFVVAFGDQDLLFFCCNVGFLAGCR